MRITSIMGATEEMDGDDSSDRERVLMLELISFKKEQLKSIPVKHNSLNSLEALSIYRAQGQ